MIRDLIIKIGNTITQSSKAVKTVAGGAKEIEIERKVEKKNAFESSDNYGLFNNNCNISSESGSSNNRYNTSPVIISIIENSSVSSDVYESNVENTDSDVENNHTHASFFEGIHQKIPRESENNPINAESQWKEQQYDNELVSVTESTERIGESSSQHQNETGQNVVENAQCRNTVDDAISSAPEWGNLRRNVFHQDVRVISQNVRYGQLGRWAMDVVIEQAAREKLCDVLFLTESVENGAETSQVNSDKYNIVVRKNWMAVFADKTAIIVFDNWLRRQWKGAIGGGHDGVSTFPGGVSVELETTILAALYRPARQGQSRKDFDVDLKTLINRIRRRTSKNKIPIFGGDLNIQLGGCVSDSVGKFCLGRPTAESRVFVGEILQKSNWVVPDGFFKCFPDPSGGGWLLDPNDRFFGDHNDGGVQDGSERWTHKNTAHGSHTEIDYFFDAWAISQIIS